jgi:hypothetical protein
MMSTNTQRNNRMDATRDKFELGHISYDSLRRHSEKSLGCHQIDHESSKRDGQHRKAFSKIMTSQITATKTPISIFYLRATRRCTTSKRCLDEVRARSSSRRGSLVRELGGSEQLRRLRRKRLARSSSRRESVAHLQDLERSRGKRMHRKCEEHPRMVRDGREAPPPYGGSGSSTRNREEIEKRVVRLAS